MKKIFLLCLCLFLLVSSVGCGQATPDTSLLAPQDPQATALPPENQPLGKYTIALVMKTLTNPFFVEMEKGARQAETELGINLIVKTGAQETSFEQQITIIEELIKEKVDAILIAPADSVQIIPVLNSILPNILYANQIMELNKHSLIFMMNYRFIQVAVK